MSLFAPRPMEERASVILPTVTCSSCSAPIPLSSLTEHVCRPPSAQAQQRAQPRQPPKLAQITIPPVEYGRAGPSYRGPPSFGSEPSPSFKRPFANSPASSSASPTSLNIPLHNPSPATLQAPSPAFGAPSPRTPSPTNPFFPHNSPAPEPVIVHGLGLGVGKAQGPFPTDAPLPPGVQMDPMASAPDMMSGGNAGMAGVGRRAFAAAAWGVRAGVAMAQAPQRARQQEMPSAPQLPSQAFPLAHPHRGPSPQPGPPPHRGPTPVPTHTQPPPPAQRGPSPIPPHSRVMSPSLSEEGSSYFERQPTLASGPQSAGPAREPPLLPRAPLSQRPRGQTLPSPTESTVPSQSHIPIPLIRKDSASPHLGRQNSFDSATSSHLTGSPAGESISQLIRARQASGDQPKATNKAFFDRYKAMVATSSGSSTPSGGTASPMLGFGPSLSRRSSEDKVQITDSPEPHQSPLSEEDDDESALPWARPGLADSPEIQHLPKLTKGPTAPASQLRRHRPAQSEGSSNSSSMNSRRGGASVESEEVVTPSASWEGIAEQRDARSGLNIGVEVRERLEQIEEDESEGERLLFGGGGHHGHDHKHGHTHSHGLKPSASNGTLASAASALYDVHSRANTAPERRGSSSASATSSQRRTKTCVKCNEVVGGTKRFVERDGVVLCEKDWKKLYLPSCRRCQLPIEKSAVSSSDGQLKGKWHRACFTCTSCDRPFEGDSFYVHGGKPWCQYHYHEENGSLCAAPTCRKPIEGACVLTPDMQRFHPSHLTCDHAGPSGTKNCRENMDEYYEVGKQRFCERHVGDALRKGGKGGAVDMGRAEKRRTKLVDMSGAGGAGFGLGFGGSAGLGASGLR